MNTLRKVSSNNHCQAKPTSLLNMQDCRSEGSTGV